MITTQKHPFTNARIDTAPDVPGVYALYDSGVDTIIYYGRAQSSIRDRLRAHKSGQSGSCTQNASYFNTEIHHDPTRREKELLEEHERMYGRLPRCNNRVG